jgi:flagellar FliL protein
VSEQDVPTVDVTTAIEPQRAPEAPKPKKKRKRIVVLGAAVVVALVAAKFTVLASETAPTCEVVGGTTSTDPAVGATGLPASTTPSTVLDAAGLPPTTVAACTPPEPGAVFALEPITLNLSDGRYLKLGLALQLGSEADAAAFEAEDHGAPALDVAIGLLGARRYDELIDPVRRDEIKADLARQIAARYEGEVLGLYFTEFVMQ